MGFSRQEYWLGLPFPSAVDPPDPGFEPASPALQVDSLQTEPPGKPKYVDDTTVIAESEEELKSLLIRVREKSEKSWLKTQHSKN